MNIPSLPDENLRPEKSITIIDEDKELEQGSMPDNKSEANRDRSHLFVKTKKNS